jgi:hypothetical protein
MTIERVPELFFSKQDVQSSAPNSSMVPTQIISHASADEEFPTLLFSK